MTLRRKNAEHVARTRGVIFDFDGTIADSMAAIVQVFEDLTGRHGRYSQEQMDAFRSLTFPQLVKALEVPRWKVPILLFRGRRMLRAHMHGIAVHEGIAETLERLHNLGIPLYVLSSNSTENVQKYLQWHKLSHCFSGVYGGASILGKAPHLLSLLKKEQVDATHSWYVGDEMRDVSAARAVGLKCAAVTWGYNTRTSLAGKEPDALVDTAEQLAEALERSWKK